MNCKDVNSKMADLLFEADQVLIDAKVNSEAQAHLAGCEACRKQLEEAETRVEILIKRAGEVTAEPFSLDKG